MRLKIGSTQVHASVVAGRITIHDDDRGVRVHTYNGVRALCGWIGTGLTSLLRRTLLRRKR